MGSQKFGAVILLTSLLYSTLFFVYGRCSPCQFEWTEHQRHCYRYFAETLQLAEAEAFCRSYGAGSGGWRTRVLVQPKSAGEILFLIDYLKNIYGGTPVINPTYVWLDDGTDETYDKYNLIYFNALNADAEDNFLGDCDEVSMSPSIAVSLSKDGKGESKVVPAPELVEHRCAVYTGVGAYLDLGDFAGTCVSDTDLCASGSLTWSLWLKMNSSVDLSGVRYFLTTGGYTYRASGVFFNFEPNRGNPWFRFGARSIRKGWTYYCFFYRRKIPMDRWIHLAATVNLNQQPEKLTVYLAGQPLVKDSTSGSYPSTKDGCTKLFLSHLNPCQGFDLASSLQYGASAAYSNLMFFDRLLTPEQIKNLYACGSLDWRLKVRHLYAKSAGGTVSYVCTASSVTGPTIYWRSYDKVQGRWQDLGSSSSRNGVEIITTSLSTCVVRSVLKMDGSRTSGGTISCTASDGSTNATVYLRQGQGVTVSYSDHNKEGMFVTNNSTPYYSPVIPATVEELESQHRLNSFICEKPDRR